MKINSLKIWKNAEPLALASQNQYSDDDPYNAIDPFEAVRRIRGIVGAIAGSEAGSASLALKAYSIALRAQSAVLQVLNANPELVSKVHFDNVSGLPSYSIMAADLISCCKKFEPEPVLKAVLDSFSGWAVLGTQKLEGCRCGSEPVDIELKIRVHHSHEIKDDKFFIEQLLGVESENKEHLEKHYGGFNQKSNAGENILIVAVSRASIILAGKDECAQSSRYEFKIEEEKQSDEVDISIWKNILENLKKVFNEQAN